MNATFNKILIYLGVLLLPTACTMYQKPVVPTVTIPHQFKARIKVKCPKLTDQWWQNFHDEQLNQLVKIALQNNYNYKVALKNIDIAKTYVTQYESALFPQVNLNFNASRNQSSTNTINNFNNTASVLGANTQGTSPQSSTFGKPFNLLQLFGSVSYQADIWNQNGNTVNEAKANVAVSAAASKTIELTLVSSVVVTYFQILTFNDQLQNLTRQLHDNKALLTIVSSQNSGGLIDMTTVDDTKNQIETIKTNIAYLTKQREVAIYALAYLLGEYPETFHFRFANSLKDPEFRTLIPAGIPSQVLIDRPDVQQAYYQIIANGYLEKVNLANFFPSIILSANDGYASSSLANFISSGSRLWNYGLSLVQPVYDYALRISEYRQAKLQYESSILSYEGTVINAFNQVDSALTSYKQDYIALHAFKNTSINSKNKLGVANAQYRAGLGDYSVYLTDDLSLLQANYNVASQKLVVATDIQQAYVAMGLGLWDLNVE